MGQFGLHFPGPNASVRPLNRPPRTKFMEKPATDPVQGWTKVITPMRGLFEVPWRELWAYRDLMLLLAWRDISAQYKQTILGPLWFLLQPLIATVAFSFLFGRMAGLGTENVPHFLFYMAGLVPWTYFSECINRTAHTFTRNSHIFGKVYFPRLAVPFAAALSNLATFLVQMAIFGVGLGIYLWKARTDPQIFLEPNWRILVFPVLVVQMAFLGVGVGLIVSSLATRYRDLALGIGFAVQIWMYGSSIVFPLSRVTDPRLRELLALNPMVPIIESVRFAFLGQGSVTQGQWLVSCVLSVGVFLLGVVMFNRTEQTAMDAV